MRADIPAFPKDPEQLAKMIEQTFSAEQRKEIISKLDQSIRKENLSAAI